MCLKDVSEMTSRIIRLYICGLFNYALIIQTVSSLRISTLREECGQGVFENMVLKKIFAPKGKGGR